MMARIETLESVSSEALLTRLLSLRERTAAILEHRAELARALALADEQVAAIVDELARRGDWMGEVEARG